LGSTERYSKDLWARPNQRHITEVLPAPETSSGASADGTPIEIPNRETSIVHAIVLLSEMYHAVDWKAVAKEIAEVTENRNDWRLPDNAVYCQREADHDAVETLP
jgi:hypothetical protein